MIGGFIAKSIATLLIHYKSTVFSVPLLHLGVLFLSTIIRNMRPIIIHMLLSCWLALKLIYKLVTIKSHTSLLEAARHRNAQPNRIKWMATEMDIMELVQQNKTILEMPRDVFCLCLQMGNLEETECVVCTSLYSCCGCRYSCGWMRKEKSVQETGAQTTSKAITAFFSFKRTFSPDHFIQQNIFFSLVPSIFHTHTLILSLSLSLCKKTKDVIDFS